MSRRKFHSNSANWQTIVQLSLVLVTILGSTIPLYIHTDYKILTIQKELSQQIQANHQETARIIESIRQDIRDFHGRLCAIEERRRDR